MGTIGKNLQVNDRVKIVEIPGNDLEGMTGTILGCSADIICKFHIVLLDKPYMGQKAINITEACLVKIVDFQHHYIALCDDGDYT